MILSCLRLSWCATSHVCRTHHRSHNQGEEEPFASTGASEGVSEDDLLWAWLVGEARLAVLILAPC